MPVPVADPWLVLVASPLEVTSDVSVPLAECDHSEAIDAELSAWNDEHRGPDITPDDELVDETDDDDGGWCSCTSTRSVRGSGTLAMLLLLGLCSRRRRWD